MAFLQHSWMLEVASSLKSDCYDTGIVGALREKLQDSFQLSFIIPALCFKWLNVKDFTENKTKSSPIDFPSSGDKSTLPLPEYGCHHAIAIINCIDMHTHIYKIHLHSSGWETHIIFQNLIMRHRQVLSLHGIIAVHTQWRVKTVVDSWTIVEIDPFGIHPCTYYDSRISLPTPSGKCDLL